MAPIIEVSEETMNTINPDKYIRRNDLENSFNKQIAELDRSNWVFVPQEEGKFKAISGYSFDINPARLAHSPAVKKVAEELNKTLENNLRINYKNTSKDSLGRKFVGNNNWKQSLMLNQFLGVKTSNLPEEMDYLHLLYLGSQNEIKVYDGSGKQIDSKLCEKLLMDTIKAQIPWRANWIDADYKVGKKEVEVHSDHIFDNKGNIINYKSEVLDEDTLKENKQIDFVDYITKNHTSQGQISKKVKSGNFYSWSPGIDNNSVAWFSAFDARAVLSCGRLPSDWGSGLGVRAAKLRE